MNDNPITALAREYAEEIRADILPFFPRPLPDSMEVLIKKDQENAERLISFLLRRYALVEKSKVDELEIARRAKENGAVWLTPAEVRNLFPEIGKEVEG